MHIGRKLLSAWNSCCPCSQQSAIHVQCQECALPHSLLLCGLVLHVSVQGGPAHLKNRVAQPVDNAVVDTQDGAISQSPGLCHAIRRQCLRSSSGSSQSLTAVTVTDLTAVSQGIEDRFMEPDVMCTKAQLAGMMCTTPSYLKDAHVACVHPSTRDLGHGQVDRKEVAIGMLQQGHGWQKSGKSVLHHSDSGPGRPSSVLLIPAPPAQPSCPAAWPCQCQRRP